MGLYQTKNVCVGKDSVNKMKREPTEWEKIIVNDISNKGLISKIHKKLKQLKGNTYIDAYIHTYIHTYINTYIKSD